MNIKEFLHYSSLIIVESIGQSQKGILTQHSWMNQSNKPIYKKFLYDFESGKIKHNNQNREWYLKGMFLIEDIGIDSFIPILFFVDLHKISKKQKKIDHYLVHTSISYLIEFVTSPNCLCERVGWKLIMFFSWLGVCRKEFLFVLLKNQLSIQSNIDSMPKHSETVVRPCINCAPSLPRIFLCV